MIILVSELERIRAKLAASPPYDWEDDIAELLSTIEHNDRAYESLREEVQRQVRIYGELLAQNQEITLLMLSAEKVITAAKRAVSGPDSENYTELAKALDSYERARLERDRTY